MRTVRQFKFQWFEPEERYRPLRLIVHKTGQLYLSRALKKRLPADILLGFDSDNLVMAIANGHGSGCALPKGSYLAARNFSVQLIDTGLSLPASFLFEYRTDVGYWVGTVEPQQQGASAAGTIYDVARLLVTHKYIINQAVYQCAKTTPIEERRAIAIEEFCSAVAAYGAECGSFIPYIEKRVRSRLLLENKHFTAIASYERVSMDTPLSSDSETAFCLYDTIGDETCTVIDIVEEKIMAEQFDASLSSEEHKLLQLFAAECTVSQIARELGICEDDVLALGQKIGQKRKQFYCAA